jgi:hypothetical protein
MLKRSSVLALVVSFVGCLVCSEVQGAPSQFNTPEGYGSGIGDDDAPGVLSSTSSALPASSTAVRTVRAESAVENVRMNSRIPLASRRSLIRDGVYRVIAVWRPLAVLIPTWLSL